MSKVKMPEPVAWMLAIQTMGGGIGWKLSWSQSGAGVCTRLAGESNEKPLITTDQAETYAQARVNEVLEEAAKECEQPSDGYVYTCADAGVASSALFRAAKAIRALKTKEQS